MYIYIYINDPEPLAGQKLSIYMLTQNLDSFLAIKQEY